MCEKSFPSRAREEAVGSSQRRPLPYRRGSDHERTSHTPSEALCFVITPCGASANGGYYKSYTKESHYVEDLERVAGGAYVAAPQPVAAPRVEGRHTPPKKPQKPLSNHLLCSPLCKYPHWRYQERGLIQRLVSSSRSKNSFGTIPCIQFTIPNIPPKP